MYNLICIYCGTKIDMKTEKEKVEVLEVCGHKYLICAKCKSIPSTLRPEGIQHESKVCT